jgi:hypothetical protein
VGRENERSEKKRLLKSVNMAFLTFLNEGKFGILIGYSTIPKTFPLSVSTFLKMRDIFFFAVNRMEWKRQAEKRWKNG